MIRDDHSFTCSDQVTYIRPRALRLFRRGAFWRHLIFFLRLFLVALHLFPAEYNSVSCSQHYILPRCGLSAGPRSPPVVAKTNVGCLYEACWRSAYYDLDVDGEKGGTHWQQRGEKNLKRCAMRTSTSWRIILAFFLSRHRAIAPLTMAMTVGVITRKVVGNSLPVVRRESEACRTKGRHDRVLSGMFPRRQAPVIALMMGL